MSSRETIARRIADQGDYIARLSHLPWSGDTANLLNIKQELESTLNFVNEVLDERNPEVKS